MKFLLAGAESVAQSYIKLGRGLSLLPTGEQQRPFIRSTMHAPDQTRGQPRLLYCWVDLAAPNLVLFSLTRELFS